jgi:murein L,D-transpeptidase YafK
VGSNLLFQRPYPVRALVLSAAVLASCMLAGCKPDGTNPLHLTGRASVPLSPAMLAELEKKNMPNESPILIRLFKEEAELEVWKQDNVGRYALLKTYPICKWSGDLGPKIKEGDRQAPEGFYSITPAQMNANSQYYLAFNLGYPNAYDQAWGRTGAHLMVHGDCSSRGCYAMTDEQIAEIFSLGRESFFGGQQAFQVQAYPFRMTPQNMAKHRNSPHLAFWKMLKRGNDHFEVSRLEPKVDVCEKRYVFDAYAPDNASTPLKFSPAGACPVFEVPEDIAQAVNDKQRQDELKTAELTSRGMPVVAVRTGRDGGMHPTFVAKLQPREVIDQNGNVKLVVDRAPGAIAYSPAASSYDAAQAPERMIEPAPTQVATNAPVPRTAPRAKDGVKPEEPSFIDRLASLFRPAATAPAAPAAPMTRMVSAAPPTQGSLFTGKTAETSPPAREATTAKASPKIGLRGSDAVEEALPKARPRDLATGGIRPTRQDGEAEVKTAATASASGGLLTGAQPIVPTSSFDSRWGAFR